MADPASLMMPAQPKYDAVHWICQKNIVYFTSRFGILLNSAKERQSFYIGHQMQISCICKHPSRRLVATGEVNIQP